MDLTWPIRAAIPSLDGPVLQALAQTNAPATLSAVHARAGVGSLSGVRKVLERLTMQGLAHRGPAGYELNRDHVAADAIVALSSLHGRFVTRVRDWLGSREERIIAAGVFGSMARREGTTDSDIDLLVVVDDNVDGDRLRDALADAVHAWTGNRGQVLVTTPVRLERMRHAQEPILDAWEKDLQMLIGTRDEALGG